MDQYDILLDVSTAEFSVYSMKEGGRVSITLRQTVSEYCLYPAYRSSTSPSIWSLTECLIHRNGIPYSRASKQGLYFRCSWCGTRGPLAVSCTDHPEVILGEGLLNSTGMPALRKHSERMECCPSAHSVLNRRPLWCCVLNRKKSRVWKPRGGSRDRLGYRDSEGPTVEFCAAFPCKLAPNNCSFWSLKRTHSFQGHHKCSSDLYGKATDRTLGNCVRGAAGKRGVAVPAGLTDPDHQEEEGCFHTRGARRNVCETWVQVGTS